MASEGPLEGVGDCIVAEELVCVYAMLSQEFPSPSVKLRHRGSIQLK